MLILHAAATKAMEGTVVIWSEVDREARSQPEGKGLWKWLAGAGEHPYHCGRDRLSAMLPKVLAAGEWLWMTAWLPSDSEGPVASDDRIAARVGRRGERLAPWVVRALMLSSSSLHELFLLCREWPSTELQFSDDAAFWRRAHELAGSLVVRQQFVPGVMELKGDWFADWDPIYETKDLEEIEAMAEAMPLAVCALNQNPRRPPADTRRWILHSTIRGLVRAIVMNAANRKDIWKTVSQTRGSSKTVPLHERWVKALLTPGSEIQGSGHELVDFAMEIGLWREPLFRLPKLELGDDAPAICLPPGGEGFWEGGKLPAPFECPEMPRRPAAILEQAGALPHWRGQRPLHESLAPVYAAASRYALEHVFGRKS
jgi:hypothetical protein